jgi:hypothetical protein
LSHFFSGTELLTAAIAIRSWRENQLFYVWALNEFRIALPVLRSSVVADGDGFGNVGGADAAFVDAKLAHLGRFLSGVAREG